MDQNQQYYYAAQEKNKRASSLRDTILVIVIALALISIGSGIFAYANYKKNPQQETASAAVETSSVPIESEEIPVEVASITGGRYELTQEIPILTYHYIRELPGDDDPLGQNLSVSPENFAIQMRALVAAGYEAITFDDVRSGNIPTNPVIITFDDGYADAYSYAYPILQTNNLVGVFYVIVGFVGEDRYLTWSEIQEMARSGMAIGSHTINHPTLTSENLTDEQVYYELTKSKEILESEIGKTVDDFCYPGGKATTSTIVAVNKAGYKSATSTQQGILEKGDYWLWLPRMRVYNNTDVVSLIASYKN